MAKIDPVIARPDLSGQIQTQRATPEAFAPDMSEANRNVAQIGQLLNQQEENKEKLWAANTASQKNLGYYQEFQARTTDPEFADKYGADGGKFVTSFQDYMKQDLDGTLKDAPSDRARMFVAERMNGVQENMMSHAIAFQAQAGGAYVKDQWNQTEQADAKLVSIAPDQYDNVLTRGQKNIDELPYLNPDDRMKLRQTYEQNISLAAGKGAVSTGPGAQSFLNTMAPHEQGSFDPSHHAFTDPKTPVTAFGPAQLDPVVEKRLEPYKATTLEQAAIHNVDPNFMMAQQAAESAGRTDALSKVAPSTGQQSSGLTQFQPATAARYGIDPTKPDQAIQGQAMYMADLLKMFNGDYKKAAAGYNWGEGHVQDAVAKYGDQWLQHAPKETQDYLVNIFSHAQPAPPAGATVEALATMQNSEPVRSGTAPLWFNKLDWKQQFDIVNDAKQGVRADAAAQAQKIELAKKQKEAEDQKAMNGFFDSMMDNKLTVQDIRSSTLDYDKKEHMINALNKGDSKTDPQVFNDLFNRIHADTLTPDGAMGPVQRITTDDQLLPYVGKGISYEDLNKLRNELHGKNTTDGQIVGDLKKNFFTMAKGQIDSSTWIQKDPIGKQKFYAFQQSVLSEIARRQAKGENISDAFNPASKDYLGNMIPAYVRTPQQQLTDYAKTMSGTASGATPAVEPRKEGETPTQYLARTGGKI